MEKQGQKPLYDEPPGGFKRRRLQNACDLCRQKKIRCDSGQMPGNICSNCIAFNSECTHLLSKRKAKASSSNLSPPQHSTTSAEGGNDFARTQISAILSTSTPYTPPSDSTTIRKVLTEVAAYARSLEKELAAIRRSSSPSDTHSSPRPVYSSAFTESKGDDFVEVEISDPLRRLELNGTKNSFFGKSSQMALLKTVIDVKNEYSSVKNEYDGKRPPPKRLAFWTVNPWQKVDPLILPPLVFPDTDLLITLVDLFFTKHNSFIPLLHRPSFESNINVDLHYRDRHFGELVLSVCAIGARFSDDPRVFYIGSDSEHSVGWEFFRQIYPPRPSLSFRPSLYEVQLICTSVLFLQSTSTPDVCWSLIGIGIRYGQTVGAHRRLYNGKKASVQNELWKRAFWVLVCIDVYMSTFLGRPRASNPADYDLDFPIACDDEFWEHPDPEKAFRQPPGKPSYVEAWVAHLKLLNILGFAQYHLFAVQKVEQWSNIVDDTWDEKAVVELDSALNKWVDEVPDHLRWNPHHENQSYFEQSSCLYSAYYWIQIQIHRPFIANNENKSSGMSYSSLAVCANAARSCSHVLDIRGSYIPFPNTFMSLFNAAIVLLLNYWRGKRSGLSLDPVREMSDVYKCVDALKQYERRWQIAGRLCDIILEFIAVSDVPLTERNASSEPLKRRRDDTNTSTPVFQGTPASSSVLFQHPQQYSGVSVLTPQTLQSSPPTSIASPAISPVSRLFGLPLHTEDLGRLPIHLPERVSQKTYESSFQIPSSSEYPSREDVSSYQRTYGGSSTSSDMGNDSLRRSFGALLSAREPEPEPEPQLEPEMLNFDPYTMGMWVTPSGDRWEDWGSYMTGVDDLLRTINSTGDPSMVQNSSGYTS